MNEYSKYRPIYNAFLGITARITTQTNWKDKDTTQIMAPSKLKARASIAL